MASLDEIAQLRRMAGLDADDETYTDQVVGTYIDNLGSIQAAAGAIWGEKAAAAASLVDVTESGSSRSLSQLQRAALAMQQHFTPDDPTPEPAKASFTVGIQRV